jgi:hypothetical protein
LSDTKSEKKINLKTTKAMFEKLQVINSKKSIERISNIFLIFLIFHLLFVFAVYNSTKFNFNNPLLPKYLAFEVFAPYAEKGLIISFGLLITTILKFFKQNLFIIIICLIIILVYYFTGFEPNFTEYKKF